VLRSEEEVGKLNIEPGRIFFCWIKLDYMVQAASILSKGPSIVLPRLVLILIPMATCTEV
jgi:hypothetical protein